MIVRVRTDVHDRTKGTVLNAPRELVFRFLLGRAMYRSNRDKRGDQGCLNAKVMFNSLHIR